MAHEDLTTQDVLAAYKIGLFPMADSIHAKTISWYSPEMRGQLPIAGLHVPERLRRSVLQAPYDIKINTAFADVIDGCAALTAERRESWINQDIKDIFTTLHKEGHAHSVESWQDGALAGGLCGAGIGGAFMGESMFSRARDASKIALVHLCARLWHLNFTVLDTQFINEHIAQFGAHEIARDDYLRKLSISLKINTSFTNPVPAEDILIDAFFTMQQQRKEQNS